MPVSPSRHLQPDLHAWLGPSSVVLPPPGLPYDRNDRSVTGVSGIQGEF